MRFLLAILYLASVVASLVYRTKLIKFNHTSSRISNGPNSGSRANRLAQQVTQYNDGIYLGQVNVGTPAQPLTLAFSTGHSDFWVIDSKCDTDRCLGFPGERHQFDTGASSTFQPGDDIIVRTTDEEDVCYDGTLGKDTVSFDEVSIPLQQLLVCSDLSSDFTYNGYDGHFGLAFDGAGTYPASPILDSLGAALDLKMFTIFLEREDTDGDEHKDAGGQITWGGVDSEHCESAITYVPVTSVSFWEFAVDKVSFGSFSQNTRLLIGSDMSRSRIGVPFQTYYKLADVFGATYNPIYNDYTVACTSSQPDLVMTISGKEYVIPGNDLLIDLRNNNYCRLGFEGIRDSDGFTPEWIVGELFLRNYCVTHDFGNLRMGFAKVLTSN